MTTPDSLSILNVNNSVSDEVRDSARKVIIGAMERGNMYDGYVASAEFNAEADRVVATYLPIFEEIIQQAIDNAVILHASDVARAVGILQGLGHPDEYLERRLAALIPPQPKDAEQEAA